MKVLLAPRAHGFTLLEMAIVLLITTLLLAGGISALQLQQGRSEAEATQNALNTARDAILGFTITNGRLPCPSDPTTATGLEATTPCPMRGLVPWRTLGIQGVDGHQNHLSYQATAEFLVAGFNTSAPSNTANSPALLDSVTGTSKAIQGSIAFALWSHGPNGHLAINSNGIQQALGNGNNKEQENNPKNTNKTPLYTGAATQAGTPAGEFDDQFLWVSRFSLFKQMLDAGLAIPPASASAPSTP